MKFFSGLARRLQAGIDAFTKIMNGGSGYIDCSTGDWKFYDGGKNHRVTITGNGTIRFDSSDTDCAMAQRMQNKSGGATVLGYIYEATDGATDNAIGQPAQPGTSFGSVTNRSFVICVGGGVAADEYDYFVPIIQGSIVRIYIDDAAAAGGTINLPPGGATRGQAQQAGGPTPQFTIAICLETTAEPGLARCLLGAVWV